MPNSVHEASTPIKFPASLNANVVLTNVTCLSSVFVGAIVVMTSAGVAYNANADNMSDTNMIGIVQNKPSSTICDIRVSGVTPAIFSGLDPSKDYYLSGTTPGLVVASDHASIPAGGSGKVLLAVGQPFSATEILVIKGLRVQR